MTYFKIKPAGGIAGIRTLQPIWRSTTINEMPNGEYNLGVFGQHVTGKYGLIVYNTKPINFAIDAEIPDPTPTPSPTSTPTPPPTIEPTPTGPSPIRFYNPYHILFGSTLLLIGLGILAYFKKYRKSS